MTVAQKILQGIVNGLVLGSAYALVALGYSMVYGILRALNFAHGDLFMVSAFVGWGVVSSLAGRSNAALVNPVLTFGAAIILSMAAGALLGLAVERVAYRPLRKSGRLAPLLSAIGVSIFLQNAVMLATQGRARTFPAGWPPFPGLRVTLGPVNVSPAAVLVILVAGALTAGLQYLVLRTPIGRAMRAVSEDMVCASYLGIPADRIISATFALGAGLAGAAGLLVGTYYTQVDFLMGFSAGMKAFTAAVLGGIGSMPGAVAGGLVLGMAESLGTLLVSPVYKDAIAFGILVLTLILRPGGILGDNVPEKV